MKFSIVFVWLASSLAFGNTYTLQKVSGNTVEWEAVGNPGFLRINGKGGWVEGTVEDKDGEASASLDCVLDSFDTDLDLRNQHMKEKYLETGKFPKAHLTLDKVKYEEGKEFAWTGKLKIKGEEKPVSGKATVTKTIGARKLDASFTLSLKDYPAIGVPSYLGVTVAEDVSVKIEFLLRD